MANADLSPEEMQRYLEEQKKKVEAMLAAMTPEERAEAEKNFAAMREADDAAMRKTLDDARKVMEMNTAREHHTIANPGAYAPKTVRQGDEAQVRFCPNCGAKAGNGNFCEYCGSPLKKQ
ncbi:MAG: hypothetical protein ACOYJY_04890 [Acutalibacteraceae bacterium]